MITSTNQRAVKLLLAKSGPLGPCFPTGPLFWQAPTSTCAFEVVSMKPLERVWSVAVPSLLSFSRLSLHSDHCELRDY